MMSVYLSGVIRETGLTVDVFQRLKDLCATHVCPHVLHSLQSLFHRVLAVHNTLTATTHTTGSHKTTTDQHKIIPAEQLRCVY